MTPFDNLKDGIDRARALQEQALAQEGTPPPAGAYPALEPAEPDDTNLRPTRDARADGTDETAQRPGGLA